MNKLKVWLLVVLIFIAGFASGVVATRIAVRHFVQQAIVHPEIFRAMIERQLTRKLRLDAAQQIKVHKILLDTHQQMSALRQQFHPEFTNILQNAESKISAVLTPEQRKTFGQMKAKAAPFLQAQ